MLDLNLTICPGCNAEIPSDNDGCPFCRWGCDTTDDEYENGFIDDKPDCIPPLYWYLQPTKRPIRDSNPGGSGWNNVSDAFMRRLLKAASE